MKIKSIAAIVIHLKKFLKKSSSNSSSTPHINLCFFSLHFSFIFDGMAMRKSAIHNPRIKNLL